MLVALFVLLWLFLVAAFFPGHCNVLGDGFVVWAVAALFVWGWWHLLGSSTGISAVLAFGWQPLLLFGGGIVFGGSGIVYSVALMLSGRGISFNGGIVFSVVVGVCLTALLV
jgi:hypothetical protein